MASASMSVRGRVVARNGAAAVVELDALDIAALALTEGDHVVVEDAAGAVLDGVVARPRRLRRSKRGGLGSKGRLRVFAEGTCVTGDVTVRRYR